MTEQKKSRIILHRETNLEADETKLVDDIEKYGCHVIHVKPQQPIPGWSYTIGLYETLQQPELIVVGMKQEVPLERAAWADWDRHGRLVLAGDGRILAIRVEPNGHLIEHELLDLDRD